MATNDRRDPIKNPQKGRGLPGDRIDPKKKAKPKSPSKEWEDPASVIKAEESKKKGIKYWLCCGCCVKDDADKDKEPKGNKDIRYDNWNDLADDKGSDATATAEKTLANAKAAAENAKRKLSKEDKEEEEDKDEKDDEDTPKSSKDEDGDTDKTSDLEEYLGKKGEKELMSGKDKRESGEMSNSIDTDSTDQKKRSDEEKFMTGKDNMKGSKTKTNKSDDEKE